MVRALCIDDDEDLLSVLRMLLPDYGVEASCTSSVDEALALLGIMDFDVVLLDEFMPPPADVAPQDLDFGRLSGCEVARRIRQIQPSLAIVGLTVIQDERIQHAMYRAGFDSILTKPVEPDVIVNELRRYTQRR